MLKKLCSEQPRQWSRYINALLFAYREVPQESTGQYVVDMHEKMEETLKIVQEELKRSQKRYQQYYNRKAKSRQLQAGDKVLILLPTDKNKLLLQWKGPFEVESSAGVNDYCIKVGEKCKMFHVNLLKKYVERETSPQTGVDIKQTAQEGAVGHVSTPNGYFK